MAGPTQRTANGQTRPGPAATSLATRAEASGEDYAAIILTIWDSSSGASGAISVATILVTTARLGHPTPNARLFHTAAIAPVGDGATVATETRSR